LQISCYGKLNGRIPFQNFTTLIKKLLGFKKLKIICTLLGLAFFSIFAQHADAFNFSFFAINRIPISEDVIILLLGTGIVGLIGLGRRRLKK
jgi:hypothetical protein